MGNTPLFESEEALGRFQARHSKETAPRAELEKATGPLYLGFDAGSTTIKAVLIDGERRYFAHLLRQQQNALYRYNF